MKANIYLFKLLNTSTHEVADKFSLTIMIFLKINTKLYWQAVILYKTEKK